MIPNPAPRPKRLWAITIFNTFAALLSVAALVSLQLAALRAGIVLKGPVLSACVPAFLIVGCVLALLGYPRGRWIALGGAVLFFGLRLTQSLILLTHYSAAHSAFTVKDLRDGVLYNLLALGLNVWAFLSAKTDDYFADKNTAVASPRSKRPVLVWIICAYYAIGTFMALASMYAVFFGHLALPAAEANFFRGVTRVNVAVLDALSILMAITAMVQLFRLRRSAPYAVTATFLVGFLKEVLYRPELTRLGHSVVLPLVGQLIALLIVIYSWRLLKRGMLKQFV